jgi:hypothetical protein
MIDEMSRRLEGFVKGRTELKLDVDIFRRIRKQVFKQVIVQLQNILVFSVSKAIKAFPSGGTNYEDWLADTANPLLENFIPQKL